MNQALLALLPAGVRTAPADATHKIAPPNRRQAGATGVATAAAVAAALLRPPSAAASKLPEAADRAWEAMGGGPADLIYPDSFLGTWAIESVLESVDLPSGAEFAPDMAVVRRAQEEDLGHVVRYQAAFVRNPRGQVVADRRFNTASLLGFYLGMETEKLASRIRWNIGDPNRLDMSLPGGLQVTTRVTRRSEEWGDAGADRLATSEFFQQILDSDEAQEPKIKAQQAFTKYHWRSAATAGAGPEIIATQIVSEYSTEGGGVSGKAGVIYTYRMSFVRV
jgi:hypothetical protein